MAVRSSTMPPRRFVSPALKALMSQRSAEFGGLILGMIALAVLLALGTYNPQDPSLNTASTQHVQNLAGPIGAVVADLLLQGFGVVAVLPALAMLAWCWRIGSRRGLSNFPLRLAALLAALPMLAGVVGAVPISQVHPWPVMAGLGGSIGQILATNAIVMTRSALGLGGVGLVWLAGGALALLLTLTSLGLSRSEWRSAGHFAAAAGRFSVRGSRFGFDTVAPGPEKPGRMGGRFSLPRFSLWRRKEPSGGREYGAEPRLNRGGSPEEPMRTIPPRPAMRVPLPPDTPITPGLSAPLPPVRTIKQVEPATRKPVQASLPLPEHGWVFPSLDLLKEAPARANSGPSEESLQANARLLETVLSDYGVQGEIVEIRPGPVVTLYELVPAPGIRSARVIGLADDVARSLSVTAVRIATVPGRNVIGIEVPNSKRETVFLSEILSSEEVTKNSGKLSIALGKDIGGKAVAADLARMPHLMIAGTTGSGKSVGVNAMILSLLYRLSPDQCRLILIDPKMLELSTYEGIPHLMAPVVTEPAKAVTALKWTVREMERRYRAMSQLGVRNIGGYNDRVLEARAKGEVVTRKVQTGFDPDTGRPTHEEQPLALEPLPFIVVVVDEMADLMMVAGKEIEAAVQRLAQMARAAGIHVIMATQRPSVDVITGTIKANFPTRISFQVISKFDSRTILGEQGAEQLLGMGDMLFMQGGGRITRVHGPFVSDEEVEKVVAYLREQGEPAYIEEVTEALEGAGDSGDGGMSGIAGASDGDKSLFDLAVDVVSREGKASTSFIQRHLNIGYNKAAKLIEQMEKEGIVGPANHVGKREILVRRTNNDDMDC
jgi:S-DNA-T family DNA segregation ATPase FtsK/SpoIIIE